MLTSSKNKCQKFLEACHNNIINNISLTVVTLGRYIITCYFLHQLVWHQSKVYEKTSVRWQLENSGQTTSRSSDVWWQSLSETFSQRWNCSVANPLMYSLCRPITGKTKRTVYNERHPGDEPHGKPWSSQRAEESEFLWCALISAYWCQWKSCVKDQHFSQPAGLFCTLLPGMRFRSVVCCDSLRCQGC